MRWFAMLAFSAILIFPMVSVQAAESLNAEPFTLDNGLSVLVLPDDRAPVVTHMLWFRLGAADEPAGKSGVAHYLEHMMFKGTPSYPDGKYDALITRAGGSHNAFTGQDFTSYYVTIAKEKLPEVMKLEADRMQALLPTDEAFAKERDVILEERRMRVENRPQALLSENLYHVLFEHHPYGIPIIGWKQEIEQLTRQDVMQFYSQYYHPQNAVLVLVGDVTRDEAEALAKQYYGSWSGPEQYVRGWPKPAALEKPEIITLKHPNVQQSQWMRYYDAPSFVYGDTSKAFPLMVAAELIGGGMTSRLYQSLVVEQKIAAAASVSYNGFALGPSVFGMAAVPADGVTLEALDEALSAELTKIFLSGFTEEELQRVKNQMKADTVYARDGIQHMAFILGQFYMLGLDVSFFSEWPERIDAVTAEEALEAAKALLTRPSFVEGRLLSLQAQDVAHAP